MIQSMTGYGKATAELPDKKINVEIKSLNSKAMDLSSRIAPAYREKEIEIRNEISRVLERGKVDFSLWIEKKESAESATPINQVLVEGYYKQIQAISENLGIPVPTDWFQTLLRMPDVMSKTEIQELTEEEWEMVRATVLEAIGHLVDFRKQEGAALEKKFREKIANIALLLEKITPYQKRTGGESQGTYHRRARKDAEHGLRQEPTGTRADLLHRKAGCQRGKTTPHQPPEIFHQHAGKRQRTRQKARFHRSGNGTGNQYAWQQVQPCRNAENRCANER